MDNYGDNFPVFPVITEEEIQEFKEKLKDIIYFSDFEKEIIND